MQRAAKRYPLFVIDFFMKRARSFMKNVLSKALGIEHYWGRVEFVPGKGQIHLHMLGIAKNKAYSKDFYKAQSLEDKATVLDKYAREKLDMKADVNIKDDDKNYFPVHTQSPLSKRFCEVWNEDEDARVLCQECMCHHCNKFCLQITRKTSHVLAVWDLVMKNILADKIHRVWTSEMRHKLKKIRKASITLE